MSVVRQIFVHCCVCVCVAHVSFAMLVYARARVCVHHDEEGEVAGRHRKFSGFMQMWFLFSVCAHVRQSCS